ncbi:hypothetical protein JYB87_02660 [Shewanella avicenniae]|uniref:Dinitrogenase iron-molybdenum cofactor biosynthesis domain-containing protein n=1 Tax=Shewanella avicenniae TaxID=2814294 RepID=A0ABX7QRU2_9GAMM|nr:NifB/NifX family molybdenum-iron cluster-binding protein [Shewanella avicenniae]QSX34167.1 hypothetical protein JYB87_02660 [Shewanella avicenniae]
MSTFHGYSERKLHIEPQPREGEFPLKVAFATGNRRQVEQHFGSARGMLIYGVDKNEWRILEAIEYAEGEQRAHDRLPARINDLAGCAAVFCNACGASAIRQLLERGIHPVKVAEGVEIHSLLQELQQELQGKPMGWLARSLKQVQRAPRGEAERLQALMDEEW